MLRNCQLDALYPPSELLTATAIVWKLLNHRANCHADSLRYGVGRFAPTARTMPGNCLAQTGPTRREMRG